MYDANGVAKILGSSSVEVPRQLDIRGGQKPNVPRFYLTRLGSIRRGRRGRGSEKVEGISGGESTRDEKQGYKDGGRGGANLRPPRSSTRRDDCPVNDERIAL